MKESGKSMARQIHRITIHTCKTYLQSAEKREQSDLNIKEITGIKRKIKEIKTET